MSDYLYKIVRDQKQGRAVGITSICSANLFVIRAALEHAQKQNQSVCIESTGQQVNQFGGYTGMKPKQFAQYVRQVLKKKSLGEDQIILGGDHLGPGAWHFENSDSAMSKAKELIRHCVQAGYRKLHLDPSVPCRDDIYDGRPYLSLETIADRTASLCEIAEKASKARQEEKDKLVYIIGAEVPASGGVHEVNSNLCVSSVKSVKETIDSMRRAFIERGLESAWGRCLALVVETGATFGQEAIYDYDGKKFEDLKLFMEKHESMVFEAHSTDFQTQQALIRMVGDHCAILKVGPWLTFAAREALYALSYIEREWLGRRRRVILSRLPELMQELAHADRTHWHKHYHGGKAYLRYITAYGFSDRIRYYWSHPRCSDTITLLFQNLAQYGIPLPLLSQYMPAQYEAVREGRIKCEPNCLVHDKIMEILNKYAKACGDQKTACNES